jgi:small subunit ribosomal protein S5
MEEKSQTQKTSNTQPKVNFVRSNTSQNPQNKNGFVARKFTPRFGEKSSFNSEAQGSFTKGKEGFSSAGGSERRRFNPGERGDSKFNPKRNFGNRRNQKNNKRNKNSDENDSFQTKVILVRRVTRVVKGGKRMRFSALVVVGDSNGKVGFGLKKGADYQDSVAKATRQAKNKLINISLNEQESLGFPSITKHKSCMIYLKPANTGTGLIAGSFVRPILELAGIKNIYSKIVRSRNKIAGTQAVIHALEKYSKAKTT